MTQATDQDIRELKSSIDSLVKQTDALAQGTAANTKAIADLVASMSGLREEMRVGFAQVDTRFAQAEGSVNTKFAQLEGSIDAKFAQVDARFAQLEGSIDTKLTKLDGKIDVIDERTKLGFWGFIGRAVIIAIFTALIAIAVRYVVNGKVL